MLLYDNIDFDNEGNCDSDIIWSVAPSQTMSDQHF